MVITREYCIARARHAIARARLFKAAAKWASMWPQTAYREAGMLQRLAADKLEAALLWRAVARRVQR